MLPIRKIFCTSLILLLLLQPVLATAPESTAPTAGPEPDILTAVYSAQDIPQCPDIIVPKTEAEHWLRSLIASSLYTMEDGQWKPVLAHGLPEDVTASYAGTYSIPQDAQRGYAYRILLHPDARWEDGSPICAADIVYSVEKLLEDPDTRASWLFLKNAEALINGEAHPGDQILSLRDAGYDSVGQAWADGHSDFYVDTEGFWGLNAGWRSISEQLQLRDYAMPSGQNEYFVTSAYLYSHYLMDGMPLSRYQKEFVGICSQPGAAITAADLGLIPVSSHELVLISESPCTASTLMQQLEALYLWKSADGAQLSYGPYRILSHSADSLLLEPNSHWWGHPASEAYDRIICRQS